MSVTNLFWEDPFSRFSVNYFSYDSAFQTPVHRHDDYAIICVATGFVEYTQFDQVDVVGRGGVVVTNGGILHASRYFLEHSITRGVAITLSGGQFRRLAEVCQFEPAASDGQVILMGKLHLPECLTLVDKLLSELQKRGTVQELMVQALAAQLLAEILQKRPRSLIRRRSGAAAAGLSRADFIRVLESISAASYGSWNLPQISSRLGLSPDDLAQAFHSMTDQTPLEFFRHSLLTRARALASSSRPILEIARTLGFRDDRQFRYFCRRETGQPPSGMRSAVIEPAACDRGSAHVAGWTL